VLRGWTLAVTLAALMASAVGLQALRERTGALASDGEAVLYVRSPEALRRLSLSYESLLADVYWIRAVQHYGGTKLSTGADKSYSLLYPLLDLTTSLDPQFSIAYHFGSLFLAEPPPGGPGRPDLAIALLEKGLRQNPSSWEFTQAIGFVHYWWYQDYPAAAEWFRRAAAMPGAPVWMQPLAAVTLAEGGRRDGSRLLWQQIARTAQDDWFKAEATRRLAQLDALDQIDQLTAVARAYETRFAAPPPDWATLVQRGYLRGVPVDPAGTPYRFGPQGITVDERSPLYPLPKAAPRPQ
jgi:tetratricopeptide (TPR) repeat protein